ncbi:uncharacterized protein C8R40DRAFT_733580 [Lentinula edodes]|uniref:uncharacterized protein n=1 Tax=Lentinula edodes TaxID=5353 RepID=UPI001E8CC954|nr:uncharacterized protein C8R40DRAFT_733580 [Lentinula edodes]KAH7869461.1 hypothetical protein C8R40DRAFT_733580 [Lentinula edodes]
MSGLDPGQVEAFLRSHPGLLAQLFQQSQVSAHSTQPPSPGVITLDPTAAVTHHGGASSISPSQPSGSTTVPGAVTSASSTMSGVMAPASFAGISSNRAVPSLYSFNQPDPSSPMNPSISQPNSFIPTPLIIPHSGVQPSPPIASAPPITPYSSIQPGPSTAPAPPITPYSGVHTMLGRVVASSEGQGHPRTVTAFPSITTINRANNDRRAHAAASRSAGSTRTRSKAKKPPLLKGPGPRKIEDCILIDQSGVPVVRLDILIYPGFPSVDDQQFFNHLTSSTNLMPFLLVHPCSSYYKTSKNDFSAAGLFFHQWLQTQFSKTTSALLFSPLLMLVGVIQTTTLAPLVLPLELSHLL